MHREQLPSHSDYTLACTERHVSCCSSGRRRCWHLGRTNVVVSYIVTGGRRRLVEAISIEAPRRTFSERTDYSDALCSVVEPREGSSVQSARLSKYRQTSNGFLQNCNYWKALLNRAASDNWRVKRPVISQYRIVFLYTHNISFKINELEKFPSSITRLFIGFFTVIGVFTTRCTIVQSAVLRFHDVRPSLCQWKSSHGRI